MIRLPASYTDFYQLKMGEAYFRSGILTRRSVFDYFFRQMPYQSGYVIFCGLDTLLEMLEQFSFDKEDLDYLRELGFSDSYIKYLQRFRFRGDVYACNEGEIVFAYEPVLQVEGNLLESQLVETVLLNILNFQSLIATRARRMRWAAGNRMLLDFGLRRAQGPGALYATRAALAGGVDATSNVYAARLLGVKPVGTMAHSFIQSFDSELEAFRTYASLNPDSCVLLVDTYDVLNSGLPNAITVAHEMEAAGHQLMGIRIDSGDLAYLSKRCRHILDQEGLHYVKIAVSNQLDERLIKSLIDQQAPIDIFGVGTSLVTGSPDAALDGIYKLSEIDGQPRIKISNTIQKITFPGRKQVYRVYNQNNSWLGADVVALRDEPHKLITRLCHPFEPFICRDIGHLKKTPLLHQVMKKGHRVFTPLTVHEIRGYTDRQFHLLPDEYKRFDNPHVYEIGLSDTLGQLRNQLIEKYSKSRNI